MFHIFDGYNYMIRLQKDELLVESLLHFANQTELKGAWISGVGGALWAELGFYNLPERQYEWQRFDQPLEITALQGNLAWKDGQPALHLHGTFSDQKFQAFGGHVKELAVAGTCELHLHTVFGPQLTRRRDADTGLSVLAI